MVNPQKNRSFLSRQGNSVALRQSRGRPSARARLTAPLGQCFFALEARLTYSKRCCSARPLPADAPLLHFPLWSGGRRFVPFIRPNDDPLPFLSRGDLELTCSRAAFIFLDELPRRRQHFAALVYEFRFEGPLHRISQECGQSICGNAKKVLAMSNLSAIIYQVAPKRV